MDSKKSKMTIDKLAVIVAKGFESNKREIEELALSTAKGFEEVGRNMARIENNLIYHIGGVNRRLDDMSLNRVKYEDHDKLKTRMNLVETKLKISHTK